MPYPHLPLFLCEILNTDAPVVLVLPHSTHNHCGWEYKERKSPVDTHCATQISSYCSCSGSAQFSHTQQLTWAGQDCSECCHCSHLLLYVRVGPSSQKKFNHPLVTIKACSPKWSATILHERGQYGRKVQVFSFLKHY